MNVLACIGEITILDLTFDFGNSFFQDRKVIDIVLEKLPVSISLGLWTTLLIYLISIPLGIYKAVNDGKKFDIWSSVVVIIGNAIPSFLFAILLIILFAGGRYLDIFPLRGIISDNWDELNNLDKIEGNVDNIEGIVLKMLDRWNKSDDTALRHREDIVKEILEYLESEIKSGTKVNQVMRHTVGLYYGQPGSKEWKKWMDFNAGVVVEGQILKELLDDGNQLLPTQWIENDQNDHLRRPGVKHDPDYKSRLVACG